MLCDRCALLWHPRALPPTPWTSSIASDPYPLDILRAPQLEGLAPWPLQLGPEFIHGDENNILKDFIDAQGWECRTLEWPDRRGRGAGARGAGARGCGPRCGVLGHVLCACCQHRSAQTRANCSDWFTLL